MSIGMSHRLGSAEALRRLASRLPEMRSRFGVSELALFGSIARDEAGEESDADVLVTFSDRPTFDHYMGLKLFLEDLFGLPVDLAIRSELRPTLRDRIEREAIDVT